jgi:hypothetical protein
MPTTESVTSREELESLIRAANENLAISPERFVSIIMNDVRELEEFARVPLRTAEREPLAPQLQAYMVRCLRVVEALLQLGFTPTNSFFWLRCFPVSDFRRKTPVELLCEDHVEHVIEDLQRVFGIGNQGFADFFEKMRADTQSIQKDIFKDTKMISVDEAARLCRIVTADLSPMDKARAIEQTKRVTYLVKEKQPVFPAYQFDDQGPKRITRWIIRTLSPYRSKWEITVWLWATNGWLDGASPADLLDSEPVLELDAAFQEIVEEKEADELKDRQPQPD